LYKKYPAVKGAPKMSAKNSEGAKLVEMLPLSKYTWKWSRKLERISLRTTPAASPAVYYLRSSV